MGKIPAKASTFHNKAPTPRGEEEAERLLLFEIIIAQSAITPQKSATPRQRLIVTLPVRVSENRKREADETGKREVAPF